jgi:hypothetical protein
MRLYIQRGADVWCRISGTLLRRSPMLETRPNQRSGWLAIAKRPEDCRYAEPDPRPHKTEFPDQGARRARRPADGHGLNIAHEAESYMPPRTPPRMIIAPRFPQAGLTEAYGTLALRVQSENVEVWIDGERWTSSDGGRFVIQLSSGRHHVEAVGSGHRNTRRTSRCAMGDAHAQRRPDA